MKKLLPQWIDAPARMLSPLVVATALSEDSYGEVVAANQAVRTVPENLAAFRAPVAGNWQPGSSSEDVRP